MHFVITLSCCQVHYYDLIDFGSQTIVQYYEKLVYRGDDSVDSCTTKVHANKWVGQNHKCLGS